MGESNSVISAYTLYRHLQQYCFHPLTCVDEPSDDVQPVRVAKGYSFLYIHF